MNVRGDGDLSTADLEAADGIVINGVNGTTGKYLLPEFTEQQLAQMARGEPLDKDLLEELLARQESDSMTAFGFEVLGPEVDYNDLAQVGWGLVLAKDDPQADAVKEALMRLLNMRKEQAMERFFVFQGDEGLQHGQSKTQWVAARGVAPGNPNYDKLPYYLLLAGDPAHLPYTFEYQLGVAHATGRISFDAVEDYARYAQSVVDTESGKVKRSKHARFFGVRNRFDRATILSHDKLVTPLADNFEKFHSDWAIDRMMRDNATQANLLATLADADGPAILFSASHGVGFDIGDPLQIPDQGGLLCQDWTGPLGGGITQDHYVAARHVPDDANVAGLIAFFFACFGGGTPEYDGFVQNAGRVFSRIAPHDFVAALPKRLLSHPQGGALATIGHVDRAWGYSFVWPGAGEQIEIFGEVLSRLVAGERVGRAVERFSSSWAEVNTAISEERQAPVPQMPDKLIAGLWTASNDRRSYVVVGDPAVTLAV